MAAGMDFQIDVPGGAVDGDESVRFAPLERRQVFQVDVDEADRGVLEAAADRLDGLGRLEMPCRCRQR